MYVELYRLQQERAAREARIQDIVYVYTAV